MEQSGLVAKVNNLYQHFTNVLDFFRNPVLLAIRLYWGWQFFLAGKGKLMNLNDTAAFFVDLNIPLPKVSAFMAASTECFGGMLLLLGLGSRLVSIPLAFTMGVALLTAHWDQLVNIFQNPDDVVTADPFLYLLASVIVMVCGPGVISLDALIKRIFSKKLESSEKSKVASIEVSRN
jgi:putative oxidoreductase